MLIETLVYILIAFLLLGGLTLAILLIDRNMSRIKQQEKDDAEKLEREILQSLKPIQSPSTRHPMPRQTTTAETPDVFAETLTQLPRQSASDAAPLPGIAQDASAHPQHQATPGPNETDMAYSAMGEIERNARAGDPVAGAIWKIQQAGQLESLEEIIPLGETYSPARAIRMSNGKRLIVLPPSLPDGCISILQNDCDALVLFPDAQTPFIATALGQQLVDNIFKAEKH